MERKILLLSIVILFFVNCSKTIERDNIVFVDEFPKTISLTGNPIPQIDNNFFPNFISICDSLLLYCDTENDPHFYLYDLPNFEYIGSFGKQGSGPYDINNSVIWDQFFCKDGVTKAWVFQMNLMKMTLVNINEAVDSLIYVVEKTIFLPPEIYDAVNVIAINDTIFVGGGCNPHGEFFIYNSSIRSLKWKPFLMDNDEKYNDRIKDVGLLQEYKRGTIKIKPDGSHFVKSYVYSPIIDVYNEDMNNIISIVYTDRSKPNMNIKTGLFDEETEIYFINVFLTDSYIYALNFNCSLADFDNNDCNNVSIDVFNWEGIPICQYYLNESIIAQGEFVVDEINKRIYTINPKSEFDYFSYFDIGDELFDN
jgi:hypothetical protein